MIGVGIKKGLGSCLIGDKERKKYLPINKMNMLYIPLANVSLCDRNHRMHELSDMEKKCRRVLSSVFFIAFDVILCCSKLN